MFLRYQKSVFPDFMRTAGPTSMALLTSFWQGSHTLIHSLSLPQGCEFFGLEDCAGIRVLEPWNSLILYSDPVHFLPEIIVCHLLARKYLEFLPGRALSGCLDFAYAT